MPTGWRSHGSATGVPAAERGGVVSLVFYAGHGIDMDGVNSLVPVDARLEHDVDARYETVMLETLVAYAPAAGTTAADGRGRNSPLRGGAAVTPGDAARDRVAACSRTFSSRRRTRVAAASTTDRSNPSCSSGGASLYPSVTAAAAAAGGYARFDGGGRWRVYTTRVVSADRTTRVVRDRMVAEDLEAGRRWRRVSTRHPPLSTSSSRRASSSVMSAGQLRSA